MTFPALRFTDLTKRFPGVTALDSVSFDVAAGSCHAICGENGAGKSTLGKILAGIQEADAGRITLNGRVVHFRTPREARASGVAMVHQELAFCENLSVAENLCLGALPARGTFVSWPALMQRASEMLAAVGSQIDPTRAMSALSVAEQQVVQIAAALGIGASVIVFDEPTSSLGQDEAERLYLLINRLKASGTTVVYVSHRMPEIFRLADAVTVLRDGHHVSTDPINALSEATLIERMIGRKLEQYFPQHTTAAPGDERLRVDQLGSPAGFRDLSFVVRAGEVVGLAGLVGAGRSELARAIFGLDRNVTGSIAVNGEIVRISSPREAMALGVGLVPEDRKKEGLVLPMLARENATLTVLPRISRWTWIGRRKERTLARQQLERMNIRPTVLESMTSTLSGGNQQKVVLAKWLAAECKVLILDEPTRGVDVGAKAELHAWIDRLASEGVAVLLISSELPELINLSSRILVLREGKLVGEVSRERATQDGVMRMMAGVA